jgi:DNA-binding NarL/FixJ family response regulator
MQHGAAVEEETLEHRRLTLTVPADRTGRLLDLLSVFSSLRTDGRILVDQIRGSINEMRLLRAQLREQQDGYSRPSGNGVEDPTTDLRNRYGLTRREAEVAMLLAKGRSNSAIAAELRISAHTARHHTQRILAKLEVHSRAEAGAKIRG